MKVLVLGITGMLGSDVFKMLSKQYDVWGTIRNSNGKSFFDENLHEKIISNIDVLDYDQLTSLLDDMRPDVVINCVGLIKQLSNAQDPLVALPINSMFPHRLARLCSLIDSRVIHISTDCVFSGEKGMYKEDDISDASDLYGKSKYIGELQEYLHCITLRTSIIGHELSSKTSLIDWFLSEESSVNGYRGAIFSGLPTIELARVIQDYVIPNSSLSGLYHVSADPINKYTLLKLVAKIYRKDIKIMPSDVVKIDRSLDSSVFRDQVGYKPPEWEELIASMFDKS